MQLGELIDWLEKMPTDMRMNGMKNPHSYRGYYGDLAVEPSGDVVSSGEMAAFFNDCVGRTFRGYKGGEYKMDRSSFVFISRVGDIGNALSAKMLICDE